MPQCGIAGKTLCGHVGHHIASVLDIGCLAERRVGTADVVVIPSQHDRANLPVAYHLIELERNSHSAFCVLIEDPGLCANDEIILLGITNPDVVVAVLAPPGRVDAFHGSLVGLDEVIFLAAETDPSEGTVAIIKQHWPHNVFNVGRENESIFLVFAVPGDLLDPCVKHGFQK